MNHYIIHFDGTCTVNAESEKEAEQKFWEGQQRISLKCYNDHYFILGVAHEDYRKS